LSAHAVRAAVTSGRSCSASECFFEAYAVAVKEPPDRPDPRLLLTLFEKTALDPSSSGRALPNQRTNPSNHSSYFFNGDRLSPLLDWFL
jgi:hypothetical protein